MAKLQPTQTSGNRIVVITGVSRGLGAALVAPLVAAGHTVVGCARSPDVVWDLGARHPSPNRFSVVDVNDDQAVRRWAAETCGALKAPDLLLNNAGVINTNAPLWQVPPDEFNQVLRVNVNGAYTVIRHFLPTMIDAGAGIVVNMSSGWGRSVAANVAPYCASKWAIEGLSQALAQELPAGLACIALNPGVIETDMLYSCFGESASDAPSTVDWAKRAVPYLLSLEVSDNGRSLSVPG